MVDTIVLLLSKDAFTITDPDKFEPSARWALEDLHPSLYRIQSRQNATPKELINGIYKPRLTLSNRINSNGAIETILKIEVSLPKLMFGNNFDELHQKDFVPLTEKLCSALKDMGITTTAEYLTQTSVAAIHYGKNIPLTDGSTPYHYIYKIKEANIKLSLDVNQTDYRNEGHSYKWHCNSYEVVFYDKIRDLEQAKKSRKRSMEKDSAVQLELLNKLQERNKLEILRMEVRLNKRAKIKQLFKALEINADLTFKELFKLTIARKVLLHYLDELENKRPLLLDFKGINDKSLLATLVVNNPELNPKQVLQMFGLAKALNVVNIRELRTMLIHCNQRSWYRLMADANKTKLPQAQSSFENIREEIINFKPLNLQSFSPKNIIGRATNFTSSPL